MIVVGLTNRNFAIPISEHQDSVKSTGKTVKDATILSQVIASDNPHNKYTSAIPNNGTIPDYLAACNLSALTGTRVGIPMNAITLRVDSSFGTQLAAFENAIDMLEAAEATLVENTNFNAVEEFFASPMGHDMTKADFAIDIALYLSNLIVDPNNVTSI